MLSAFLKSAGRVAMSALFLAAAAAAPQAQTASPNERINLLVMSDDADTDTVPRNHRVFNRVQLALSSMDITRTNRVRRTDAQLYEIARLVPTPIDVIVVYQIYASVRTTPNVGMRVPVIRIPGRILYSRTGQFIGTFEVGDFQLQPLPVNCQSECVLENVGAQARVLANDLGSAIAQKLTSFVRAPQAAAAPLAGKDGASGPVPVAADGCSNLPTDYVFQLRDFSASEVTRIEGEFVRWGCYQQHRTTQMSATSADFFYRTSADSARITRNFRLMLELVGLNAQVTMSQNRITVTRIATR